MLVEPLIVVIHQIVRVGDTGIGRVADNGIIDAEAVDLLEGRANARLRLEIVKRTDDLKCFVVLPRRWVVERTFSWFGRNRRLAKDYENLAETLAAFVTLAAIQFAIRRLARR